jgi:PilZ domain
MTGDRRTELRMPANRTAKIAYPNETAMIVCKVSDVSLTGAQLEFGSSIDIPEAFDLIFDADGLRHSCQIIWRNMNRVGVAFR